MLMVLAAALAANVTVPPASIYGVYKGCAKRSISQAVCRCFIKNMSTTPGRRLTLDAMGTVENDPTERAMAAVGRRHGATLPDVQRTIDGQAVFEMMGACASAN